MSLGNASKEMLWIDAWSLLYELLEERHGTRLLDAEWVPRSVEEMQGLIQRQAYASQQASFERTWFEGNPALRVTFTPAVG